MWFDRKHIKDDLPKKKEGELEFEHVQVQVLNQTSGMLAIGVEPRKKDGSGCCVYFHIRPAPGSRKTHIISNEQADMIKHKTFVTNKHILIQFYPKHIPVKDKLGCIKDLKSKNDRPQTVVLEANG